MLKTAFLIHDAHRHMNGHSPLVAHLRCGGIPVAVLRENVTNIRRILRWRRGTASQHKRSGKGQQNGFAQNLNFFHHPDSNNSHGCNQVFCFPWIYVYGCQLAAVFLCSGFITSRNFSKILLDIVRKTYRILLFNLLLLLQRQCGGGNKLLLAIMLVRLLLQLLAVLCR